MHFNIWRCRIRVKTKTRKEMTEWRLSLTLFLKNAVAVKIYILISPLKSFKRSSEWKNCVKIWNIFQKNHQNAKLCWFIFHWLSSDHLFFTINIAAQICLKKWKETTNEKHHLKKTKRIIEQYPFPCQKNGIFTLHSHCIFTTLIRKKYNGCYTKKIPN